MITRVVLVRHGEPVESVHGRCYGRLDVALSARGRTQSEEAARTVADYDVAAVYASPRRRAIETAEAVARPRALGVIVDDRLREIDFGAFEGLTWDEARARHPEVYDAWMTRPTTVTFPGGESWTALRTRAIAAARELVARHAGATFAVVAHGGVTRALLADALALPDEHVFRLDQTYGGVSIIDWIDGNPVTRIINHGWRDPGYGRR